MGVADCAEVVATDWLETPWPPWLCAPWLGTRNVLDRFDGRVELFAYFREDFFRLRVILRANLRARFLQALPRIRDQRLWSAQFLRRYSRRLGGLEQSLELCQLRGDRRQRGVGGASRFRLAVAGLAGRVLRALPRVDGVAEGLAVVALIDGGARFLKARRGRGVFLGGVDFRAAGSRQIDGRLGLVDLFLWWLRTAASGEEDERNQRSSRRQQQVPR
jgi:hypothetical protein